MGPAQAKVFLTQEEALKLAFPGEAAPERKTAFLTDAQAERARAEAGQPVASRVVTYYELGGVTAWFDTHVVRTLPETIMVVVEKDGAIRRIDVLSFSEPEDYLPRPRWNQQLHGRKLDEELSLRRGIRPLTGATLSARAVVSASRRILALHRVLVAAP
ncbi:MAG TPA: FMN-binding protein [Candidatus Polarisedimenticolia bacterium]|nr:FMN-binding protein [Candidatus Polarisedimenticolia bacterium]